MGIVNPWVNPTNCQCVRAQTNASGVLTWTFTSPFEGGVVPIVTAIVETAPGVTEVLNAQVSGTPTNTSVTIRVNRTVQSVVALLGLTILSVPASVGVQWVHLKAEAP